MAESVTDSAPVAFVPSNDPVLFPNLSSNMLLSISDDTEFFTFTKEDSASGNFFGFLTLFIEPLVPCLMVLGLLVLDLLLAKDSSFKLTVLLFEVVYMMFLKFSNFLSNLQQLTYGISVCCGYGPKSLHLAP